MEGFQWHVQPRSLDKARSDNGAGYVMTAPNSKPAKALEFADDAAIILSAERPEHLSVDVLAEEMRRTIRQSRLLYGSCMAAIHSCS